MNEIEVKRAIECMREDGFADHEIEEELEIVVKPKGNGDEEPVWVSCFNCDALPGDLCKLSTEDIEAAITIHACRVDATHKFADLVDR